MEQNAASFILTPPSAGKPVYYHAKEDESVIDLGLSLKTMNPHGYHPSNQFGIPNGYTELQIQPHPHKLITFETSRGGNNPYQRSNGTVDQYEEEVEGVQSKERWAYVKVNMDGVIVGRKICVVNHDGYPSLALQLEDMFGRLSISGLRLFQPESDFSLFYMDKEGNWRPAGDVTWREFVDCVKRLRIVRKQECYSSLIAADN